MDFLDVPNLHSHSASNTILTVDGVEGLAVGVLVFQGHAPISASAACTGVIDINFTLNPNAIALALRLIKPS